VAVNILTVLEIRDDVREECEKYGRVLDIKVPRPSGGSRQSPGVGKIFVKFESVDAATGALKVLAGRKFADRTVVTTYYSEVSLPHWLMESADRTRKISMSMRGSCRVNLRWDKIAVTACRLLLRSRAGCIIAVIHLIEYAGCSIGLGLLPG
jgi:hypothetical protein